MKNGSAAIFVDGDNISSTLFEGAYDRLQASHQVSLIRVYGDYSQNSMAKWHELCRLKGFEQIQCANSPKKNSTDLKLIDDIYFNLYENQRVKTYIIVSNDRDYTFVVQRLKSKGKKVIIVGHNNTPTVYKNLADEFITLKSDKKENKQTNGKKSPEMKPTELEKPSSDEDNSDKPIGKKRKRKNKKKKNQDEENNTKEETTDETSLPSSPETPLEKSIDKKDLYMDAENVILETLKMMGDKEEVISSYKKKLNKAIDESPNADVRLFFLPFGRLVDILEENFTHLLDITRVKEGPNFVKILLKAKENDLNL